VVAARARDERQREQDHARQERRRGRVAVERRARVEHHPDREAREAEPRAGPLERDQRGDADERADRDALQDGGDRAIREEQRRQEEPQTDAEAGPARVHPPTRL